MRLLVRMERPQSVCAAIVLGLVVSDAVATGWDFLQRILVASYTPETLLGDTDSQRAAPFRVLAFRFLGMDRRGSGFPISLRGGFFNAAAGNPRRQSPRRLNRACRCINGVLDGAGLVD